MVTPLKGTVSVVSSDPPCKEGNAQFTTVPLKTFCVRQVQKYACKRRAGRPSWGTIVLSRERTERSRTIPSFRKKNERIECVLKNI